MNKTIFGYCQVKNLKSFLKITFHLEKNEANQVSLMFLVCINVPYSA